MNWSKEWKTLPVWPEIKQVGWDLGAKEGDKLTVATILDGKIINIKEGEEARKFIEEAAPITEKAWNNLKPTHDPYTNPNAFLYYECACGARLDPHVKSFAALNNVAMNSDWKIRFGHDGYVPYCPKCGEGVE